MVLDSAMILPVPERASIGVRETSRARVQTIVAASAFSWLSFAVMTVLAVWNEGRPGTPIADPILAATPYVAWIDRWNYCIWLAAWMLGIFAILFAAPAAFVRLMLSSGLVSLLRGVCIVATGLAPVRGPDVNVALPWDWDLRMKVVLQILNPIAVFIEDSAHIWLTKDLFFSGHASSTLLLVLFGWPMRRLRWVFILAHLFVVATLFFGHLHYTVDVIGGWAAAVIVFLVVRRLG